MPRKQDLLTFERAYSMKFDLWVVDAKTGVARVIYRKLGARSSKRIWRRWAKDYSKGKIDSVLLFWPRNKVPHGKIILEVHDKNGRYTSGRSSMESYA